MTTGWRRMRGKNASAPVSPGVKDYCYLSSVLSVRESI